MVKSAGSMRSGTYDTQMQMQGRFQELQGRVDPQKVA